MTGLKEVRSRINSVKTTRKITSAMKMVAASRLRQVQNKIGHVRVYEKKLIAILRDMMLVAKDQADHHFLCQKQESRNVLIVAAGSNRGMCGVYNAMVIKHTLKEIAEREKNGYRVRLMTIGKKPFDFFSKQPYPILLKDDQAIDKLDATKALAFADQVKELYLKHQIADVVMVYHRFRNAAVQDLRTETLLPINMQAIADEEDATVQELAEYDRLILEPSPEEVWHYMTSRYLHMHCLRILLDAAASEHGSRLTAMHHATDNADKLLKSLSLAYNKARQANITRELMDIMGGANG